MSWRFLIGNFEGCFHFKLNIIKCFFHVLSIVELLFAVIAALPLCIQKKIMCNISFLIPPFLIIPLALLYVLAFICFLCRMNVADGNTQWARGDRFFFLCAQSFCVYLCYWFNIWSHLIPLCCWVYISIFLDCYCLRDNCLIVQERERETESFFILMTIFRYNLL